MRISERFLYRFQCTVMGIGIMLMMAGCAAKQDSPAKENDASAAVIPANIKWSERMARSVIKRYPKLYRSWGYVQGLILHSFEELWDRTHDDRYLQYIQAFTDDMITEKGRIKGYKIDEFKLDDINAGRILFGLYNRTKKEKYRVAMDSLRKQLKWQPKTSGGGFWHKLKYPWQMWLDGAYMASPFLAEYAKVYGKPGTFDMVVQQIILMQKHLRGPETGLYYHGWDESHLQSWADPQTGTSASFWGRGMGWYGMAIVDILDYLPKDHPKRGQLIHILQDLVSSVVKYQDEKTGLWYQVVDQGNQEGNYLEGSASSMFVYVMAKGVNEHYLDAKYLKNAQKGYQGLLDHLIRVGEDDGEVHLTQICETAGLGPERDGSYQYYINEKIRRDDMKATGPFILASLELNK